MLTPLARRLAQPVLRAAVRLLARIGIHPNTLTVLGAVLCLPVVWCLVAFQATWPAGIALAGAGLVDALDGALARATDRASPFGAFLDSVVDRISESIVCFGLVLYAQATGDVRLVRWTVVLLSGSVLVSYTRARADGIGVGTQCGSFGRLERTITIVVGLLSGFVLPAVVLAAVGSWATALQRVADVWQRAPRAPGAVPVAGAATPEADASGAVESTAQVRA